MKNYIKRWKIWTVAFVITASSVVSYSFVDSYFEISKNLDIFASLYRELNNFYVEDTDPGKLMKTGIDAMLASLDPYTNYITESDIEDYRFMTTGEYGGIGAIIRNRNGYVLIAEPYENSPAKKEGLVAGDIILEVDGKSAKNKSTSELSNVLKGQPGTEVKLLIKRPGEEKPFEKNLTREEIKVKDVPYYGVLKDDIGYIKLTSFTQTASKEVIEAFKELKEKNKIKGLIFDLRGNGGGLLREAVNIVNVFVPKGQDIVSTKGKVKKWDRTHVALNQPIDLEMPLAVLINSGSASASEIVSGSIQDLDRGVLIGEKSYGKGLVQQTRDLSYNAKLKVTVAKYYIPSGRCIQKIDYSKKNRHGNSEAIPDSLSTFFKTKNGRVVKDSEGITPDIHVENQYASNITRSLVTKMLVFDYATEYRKKHDTILQANEFSLTDAEYNDFMVFLKDKDYDYTTQTEKQLEELIATAKEESYLDKINSEMEILKKELEHNKKEDLSTFKAEIKKMIENEIVSRYYYQRGRIENSLAIDDDVIKAVEVLHNPTLYTSILDGTYVPEPKNGDKKEEEKSGK